MSDDLLTIFVFSYKTTVFTVLKSVYENKRIVSFKKSNKLANVV